MRSESPRSEDDSAPGTSARDDAVPAVVRCAACGTEFDGAAWATLALAARIDCTEVRRLLVDWPENLCIEVRSCRQCGREIPKKHPAGSR